MGNAVHHRGDDELLMVLMDAPTRWVVRNGAEAAPVSTLRQALHLARELSASKGVFLGRIVKQPNDEMVVETPQIVRLLKQLDDMTELAWEEAS